MLNSEEYEDHNTNYLQTEDLDSLKGKISKDPWNQDLYTEAIHLASTQRDHDSLEYFTKEFFKYCAADDNFWLSYIEEKRTYLKEDEVVELYKYAIKNEPSVYIWLSYLEFVFENSHTLSDFEKLRELFETSLDLLGLHALDGPQLWSEYRRFEQELLTKVPKEEYENQIDRIRSLFYRQLQTPLAGLPDLFDEYLVWEAELPKEYQKPTTKGEEARKKGLEAWEQRKFFELKIQSDFHEMMSRDNMNSMWNDYIDFELKCGDMARIMIVYHRALDDLGFERDDLWINYANYALQTSYVKSLNICERACRHMPRSLNIWTNYFLVVSSKSQDVKDILNLLEKSTSAVLDVNHKISLHITAADCVRRVDFKDIVNCRYVLSKCWSELDPEYSSRAVYRLLTYWSKYELKLLSFNLDTQYVQVVGKLLERFRNDPYCWLYVIDTVKGLNPESPNISNTVSHIYKGFSSMVDFTTEFEPKNLHMLIIWLYELSLTVLNANDLAEEYIDYVQSSGVVEDIKRAHKVVAAHSTPITLSDTSSRSDSLSLTNLVKRDRRRRKLETFSETSSDSGSYSSLVRRPYRFASGIRSPNVSTKDGEFVIRSPKMGSKDYDQKSPKFGHKDHSYSDEEFKSIKITLRDLETATRATWFGGESFDPSIAPAVPPNAPMPPPSSPVLSRITSRLSNSGSCSPDLTPELRSSKGSNLPPPLILSSDFTNLSGADPSIKLSDPNSNAEYRLNFSTADSESVAERLSSDTDSQTDRFESPTLKYPKEAKEFNIAPDDSAMFRVPDSEFDTSFGTGHFLLSRKECVMNWLSGGTESSTVFVSGFEKDQVLELEEFFSKQPGFVQFRPVKNKACCYVEFSSKQDAETAIDNSKRHFKDYQNLSVQFSRPTKPLFEEKVIFVKIFQNEHNLSKLKLVLKEFFKEHGFNVKDVRTTKVNNSKSDRDETEGPDKTEGDPEEDKNQKTEGEKYAKFGCYVEFDFQNASKKVICKLINEFGWPIMVKYQDLQFQVLPSIPMVGHTNLGRETSRSEHEPKNELYICNLNYNTDENRLKEYLEENCGPVKNVKICRDPKGNSKGYAFVEFVDDKVYSKLFNLSLVLDDRKLYVSKSKSHSKGQSHPPTRSPPKVEDTGQKEQTTKEGGRGKYKRYKEYKTKIYETYSKLKKKIKLN